MANGYERAGMRMVPATAGQIPRHDLHAEYALLNSILTRAGVFDEVSAIIGPKHFYGDHGRFVMQTCCDLAESGTDANESSVRGHLVDRAAMSEDDIDRLMKLIDDTPRSGKPTVTATRLRDLWVQRQACDIAHRIAAECYGDVGDVTSYVDQCVTELGQLADTSASDTMVSLHGAIQEGVVAVQDGSRASTATYTGLRDYDRKVCGFSGGELIIVGARPGMGKTSLAMDWAIQAARKTVSAVFSCEMVRQELAIRAICSRARVDGLKLKAGQCGPDEWRLLTQAAAELSVLPVYIDHRSTLRPSDIRSTLNRLMAKQSAKHKGDGPPPRLGLVVVDYLQLLDGSAVGPRANREQQVAYCSRQLKSIAKEFNVPVVALAQLNRPTKGVKPAPPQLSDLRESGQIEQDADNVTFIHREEVYLREKTPDEMRGIAQLSIAKARSGSTGSVRVRFFDYCTLFADLSQGEAPYSDD